MVKDHVQITTWTRHRSYHRKWDMTPKAGTAITLSEVRTGRLQVEGRLAALDHEAGSHLFSVSCAGAP